MGFACGADGGTTMIPDAAIKAAAEGAWRDGNPEAVVTWAELDPFAQSIWRDRARAAVEAAMPAIEPEVVAKALEAWADELDQPPYDLWKRAAPHRLRARAAEIRGSTG